MALIHMLVGTASRSAKSTYAALNNVVVQLPEGISYTKAMTTHNATGIPIPSPNISGVVAGAAGSLSGTYLYAITYADSVTGTGGAPVSTISVAPTSNQVSLIFTAVSNETANSRVNAIDIWRSLAGGNVLFWLKRVAHTASNYVDNATDASISVNDTLKVANQAHRELPQNRYLFVIPHQERLFVFGHHSYRGNVTTNPAARYQGVAKVSISSNALSPTTPVFASVTQRTVAGFAASKAVMAKPGTTIYEGKGNQARWCEKNNPDAWPTDNIADIGGPEPIRSAAGMGNAIYVFKDNQIFSWLYRNDPDKNTGDGSIYDTEVNRGAVTFKSVINVDGSLFCMDRKGWYQYRGGQSIFELGEPIKPILDRVNWDQVAQISGAYDERRVYWFLPLDGETECRYAVVLDRLAFESGRGVRWWLYHIPQGVRDAASGFIGEDSASVNGGIAGRRVCAIITADGYDYFFADVYTDGVHPDLTDVGTTSTAASTVFGGGTFLSGDNDVRGAVVRFRHDRFPGDYIVQSCAATNFVIAGGSLGSTVPAGTSFTIGSIHAYWKSRQFAIDGAHDKKTGYGLDIEYVPVAKNSQTQFSVVGDRLASVINSSSSDHTGWATRKHDDYVLVDMGGKLASHGRTGFVEVPLHTFDYGYLQVVAGQSGETAPFFINGFGVSELKRRTNR